MIISITNQKGGVGKTTTALNFGACLCEANKKILLIDLDPQSGLTISLGFNPDSLTYTSMHLLNGQTLIPLETQIQNLFIIPANIELATAELQMLGKIGFEKQLKQSLDKVQSSFDYLIIDCSPSLGLLTANALVAANHIIIPVQCEYLSMRALVHLHKIIETAKEVNPNLTTKVLFTMYLKSSIHSQEVITEVKQHYPVYNTIITKTIQFAYSSVAGKPLVIFNRNAEQSIQYKEFTKEFLNDTKTVN